MLHEINMIYNLKESRWKISFHIINFQIPYNTINFVALGNGDALNFFTVGSDGRVFLKSSLLQTTVNQFVVSNICP